MYDPTYRSTTNGSRRYYDTNAETFILAVTKVLSSTIKITYADDELLFSRRCQQYV